MNPKSVAIVGASESPGKVGSALATNLIKGGYKGRIYPINPKRSEILGQKAYKSLSDVGEPIDLVVIATPSKTVVGITQECADLGVKSLVIISAGFKELGEPGIALEKEILAIAKKANMRIVGPNCLGVMNPLIDFNATFASKMAPKGNVAFISQSGALCTAVLDRSFSEGLGFSAFVSLGSMLDIGWGDLIDFLSDDPNTSSIFIYMETIGDAKSFLLAAQKALKKNKPIVILKAGRTEEAALAAASHTGSLAGSDAVISAAIKQVGAIRAENIADFFNLAQFLSKQPLPKGQNLAIITNAGGPGVLATDGTIESGALLATLSEKSISALNKVLPEHWSHGNPIDVLGDASAEQYAQAFEIVDKDPGISGLLVILTPQDMTDPTGTAKLLLPFAAHDKKPVLASWFGGKTVTQGEDLLKTSGIPCFAYPDNAARVFGIISSYAKQAEKLKKATKAPELSKDAKMVQTILDAAKKENRPLLSEFEAKEVIHAYGIPTVLTKIAENSDKAASLAEEMGFPIVVKLYSHTITHKTDVGGVKLNLKTKEAVIKAFEEIEKSTEELKGKEHFQGVTVQKMISLEGQELILGSSLDTQVGPVILFGTGGTLVEVFKDSSLGLAPLTPFAADEMMQKTLIFEALKGVRGNKGVDLKKLREILLRFSQLITDFPRIQECDINPLLASEEGIIALDARIVCHDFSIEDKDLPRPSLDY